MAAAKLSRRKADEVTTTQRSSLPLFGIKVVDFGQYIAGPAVAMVLADLGATVVHIDPPTGPSGTARPTRL